MKLGVGYSGASLADGLIEGLVYVGGFSWNVSKSK